MEWRLDRLGRSLKYLIEIVEELKGREWASGILLETE